VNFIRIRFLTLSSGASWSRGRWHSM